MDVPRVFRLVRRVDVSGVTGEGTIAEGCEFADGTVALRWHEPHPSTAVWERGVPAVLAVHGHDGATVVEWLDEPGFQDVHDVGSV